jgi:acyl-CoA thioesterase YciA
MQQIREMGLVSTHYVMAKDVGYHGNLFGGVMMSWLDEAGCAFACQVADTGKMVTKHISALTFDKPVRPGQLIKIYARVIKIGTTSLTIELEARRHSIYNGTQKTVCKCNMVFVRIDGDGEPVPIPEHVHHKRYLEANGKEISEITRENPQSN